MKKLSLVLLLVVPAFTSAIASSHEAQQEKRYQITADGKVDWYTFSGYRRYHSECHVCHGPAGLGSSFAPSLLKSMQDMDYAVFLDIIVNGRVNVTTTAQNVMPAFATNLNVMCFVDDIYTYLVARADGAVAPGRPKKVAKPKAATERDNACFGP